MTSAIPSEVVYTAPPEVFARHVADAARPAKPPGHAPSVRTARHAGHDITVTTTYQVSVDGAPVTVRLTADDAGTLHSPGLPYRRFGSALDAVRALISAYPDHFTGGA
ncbi:hypothetical protein [Streptomyces sp. NPDC057690]|uniref:hypothetical protein n=1 Tax=Streptomyces sp. NPDC057690 TaxID=3346214 RepID=UPI0036B2C131